MRCSISDIVQGGECGPFAGQPFQVLDIGTGAQCEGSEVRGRVGVQAEGTLMATSGAMAAPCAELVTVRCMDTTDPV